MISVERKFWFLCVCDDRRGNLCGRLGLISFLWLNSNCKTLSFESFLCHFVSVVFCVFVFWTSGILQKLVFLFFSFSKFMYKALEIP